MPKLCAIGLAFLDQHRIEQLQLYPPGNDHISYIPSKITFFESMIWLLFPRWDMLFVPWRVYWKRPGNWCVWKKILSSLSPSLYGTGALAGWELTLYFFLSGAMWTNFRGYIVSFEYFHDFFAGCQSHSIYVWYILPTKFTIKIHHPSIGIHIQIPWMALFEWFSMIYPKYPKVPNKCKDWSISYS